MNCFPTSLVSTFVTEKKICGREQCAVDKDKIHLLLLHQLGVGAVVDDIAAKDGRGQVGVDLLSVDILELAVEDEVVAGRAHGHGGLLAEKDKGKDIAKLFAVLLEELGRVHAVGDGASNNGEPVEDHGRLVGVPGQELVRNVEDDGQEDQTAHSDGNLGRHALLQVLLDDGIAPQILKDTHAAWDVTISRERFERG
jgi:hypothetical protein